MIRIRTNNIKSLSEDPTIKNVGGGVKLVFNELLYVAFKVFM